MKLSQRKKKIAPKQSSKHGIKKKSAKPVGDKAPKSTAQKSKSGAKTIESLAAELSPLIKRAFALKNGKKTTKKTAPVKKKRNPAGIDVCDLKKTSSFELIKYQRFSDDEGAPESPKKNIMDYDYTIRLFCPNSKADVGPSVDRMLTLLTTAWADRVTEVAFFATGHESPSRDRVVMLAACLTPDWSKALTLGPPANAPEAKAFRKFYGEKSQMRKFMDNAICEGVLWYEPDAPEPEKRNVLFTIADYVFQKHFKKVPMWLRTLNHYIHVTPQSEYTHLASAYEVLENAFRSLKDFPLGVSSVVCTSPYIRGTELYPPVSKFLYADDGKTSQVGSDGVARTVLGEQDDDFENDFNVHTCPYFTAALPVMLTLEHSGKFGDTPQIVNKFKVAFYIELAGRLKDDFKLFAVPTEKALYVAIQNVAFVVEIGQSKEIALARRLADTGRETLVPPGGDWKTLEHRIERVPQISISLSNIGRRYTAFSPTCQLTKLFLASHLLLEHFDDVAVELLVAHAFLRAETVGDRPPLEPTTGFLRVVQLLATHDFASTPLFVDFNGSLDAEKRAQLKDAFTTTRHILPPLVIYSSADDSGIRFTKNCPELAVFARTVAVAKSSLKLLEQHYTGAIRISLATLLSQSMDGFDAVIKLHSRVAVHKPAAYMHSKKVAESLKYNKDKLLPVVNFDPVQQLLSDLKAMFDSVALFFVNRYGGEQIGVYFRPGFVEQRAEFGIKASNCHKLVEGAEAGLLVPSFDEFVENVKILGAGLVKEVVLKRKR